MVAAVRDGRLATLTALTMTAFAANSILCRQALDTTPIDPATFTVIRLVSGAATLWLIVRVRNGGGALAGSWTAVFSLFAYAASFSFAYVSLSAGTGALILFGAVQATMIVYGLLRGERFTPLQTAGLLLALGGLVALMLPGVTAPHWTGATLTTLAGIAWGAYSLIGRASTHPIETTAGNFLRAAVFGALLSVVSFGVFAWDPRGVLLLGEHRWLRLVLCSVAILGGIALVLHARRLNPR